MFSCMDSIRVYFVEGQMAYMGTGIETLGTIASVKQERFIVLYATQLVSQAFDLWSKSESTQL